jgi:hypothetical protein
MKKNLYESIPGAPNFKWKELVYSQRASIFGINNIPKEDYIWNNLEKLCVNILQPLRDIFGPLHINSGYRCLALNTSVGSAKTSSHLIGEAADIVPVNKEYTVLDLGLYVTKNLKFREVIFEYLPHGWLHVSYRENDNHGVIKLKDSTHNYEKISIDEVVNLYNKDKT